VNIAPRPVVRSTRTDSPSEIPPPSTGVNFNSLRGRSTLAAPGSSKDRSGTSVGLGIGVGSQNRPRVAHTRSDIGSTRAPGPQVRSPGHSESGHSQPDNVNSRFFHASDATRQEPAVRKPEPKRPSVFFYADGSREAQLAAAEETSMVTPKRSSNPWPQSDTEPEPTMSPPLLSPTLSSISMSSSPFFAPLPPTSDARPPSPSKENIHLSYRRGASQIFGIRPSPVPTSLSIAEHTSPNDQRRGSMEHKPYLTSHRKSTSLSSIDSGNSAHSRRRSATTLDPTVIASSPLSQETSVQKFARLSLSKAPTEMPSIEASLEEDASTSQVDGPLSPTKSVSELAADARRERKVLDLEISNSSLLAINSSLEREVRRQKAELKRFRRLSRAGKFGFVPDERTARLSEGLSPLGEEEEEEDYAEHRPLGLPDVDADFSDDDEIDSVTSGGEPLSPDARESKENARLAKDEQRLRVDIEKHKELLVQSQMMNQSLKRCMYATEEMINDGKKALQYHVRVSDIKLGGRILSNNDDHDFDHEDDEHHDNSVPDIEVEDETLQGADMASDPAKGFLDVWSGLGGGGFEGSEGGDRDSGIEVDKPSHTSTPGGYRIAKADNGRPPDIEHWHQRR